MVTIVLNYKQCHFHLTGLCVWHIVIINYRELKIMRVRWPWMAWHTHAEQGDLISLLLFPPWRKESRLKYCTSVKLFVCGLCYNTLSISDYGMLKVIPLHSHIRMNSWTWRVTLPFTKCRSRMGSTPASCSGFGFRSHPEDQLSWEGSSWFSPVPTGKFQGIF
jgi:hypothetical protein